MNENTNTTMNQATETAVEAAEKAVEVVKETTKVVPQKSFMKRHENAIYVGVGAFGAMAVAGAVYGTAKFLGPRVKSAFNAAGDAWCSFTQRKDEEDSVVDSTAEDVTEEEESENEDK